MEQTVYALSIHADYRCRQSGVCCTSDWDVPVELPLYPTLAAALAGRRLTMAAPPDGGGPALIEDEPVEVAPEGSADPALPEGAGAMVARTARGDCVFYHRSSGLCVIQRDLGEPMLPSTCRHFPRLAVRDRRGTFISLTHYCPTAAGMLFRDDVPVEIVTGPAAFPPANYDGLTVHPEAWPPLLHPRMLMDLDAYSAWERHMVARCADTALTPEAILATLERDARLLRAWVPDSGSLVQLIGALPRNGADAPAPRTLDDSLVLFQQVIAAVPKEWTPAPDEDQLGEVFSRWVAPVWTEWQAPLRRYLAAKAFASWTAYQGRGLLTIVRGLEAALALVRVEAARQCRHAGRPLDGELMKESFRAADFLLNHLAAGEDLATAWSEVESTDN